MSPSSPCLLRSLAVGWGQQGHTSVGKTIRMALNCFFSISKICVTFIPTVNYLGPGLGNTGCENTGADLAFLYSFHILLIMDYFGTNLKFKKNIALKLFILITEF
jgi:hypothetical protein